MVGNHCCKIMRKLFICLCALCFSVAAELPQTWNEYQNTNETKGIQSGGECGNITSCGGSSATSRPGGECGNITSCGGSSATSRPGGECGNITSCGGSSATSRPDMETTKDSGSNAAGTSMPNYAIIILAIISALQPFFLESSMSIESKFTFLRREKI
ncbi:uncharacterized protein LOC115211074 isoform X2 [Octopus sinensis]|uniref:Uncharacterized protein LOC115211074 isoform X2 n=1 Tax=Octopus sinensis TaxID=2607531 RepID=A0A7E6EQQ9_9MOLL|nr:uncharacterized protein LOC115211074 isoform X2 [Octopus sinensis]